MTMSKPDIPTAHNNQDFVIREGFPVLRQSNGQPWLEGEEPLPTAPVRVFNDALTTSTTADNHESPWPASLYQDCRTVFSARTRDDDQAYSAGITYFLPAAMKPRCALEAIVHAIFQAHTACLPEGAMVLEQSGAEWWTLVLDDEGKEAEKKKLTDDSNNTKAAVGRSADEEHEEEESDEVGLHFDADYGLENQITNLFLHPRIGTVTYLTDCGAPTVVLERQSPQQGKMESLNGPISNGWLCHPRRGRHLAFDGRLLHGAPATFFPSQGEGGNMTKQVFNGKDDTKPPAAKKAKLEDGKDAGKLEDCINQRITLLVNVWVNHCPMDADPLDDEICAQLTTPMDSFKFTRTLLQSVPPEGKVYLKLSPDDPAGEEEVVIGNRIVTAYYGPTMEDLHAAAAMASTVKMEFGNNALRLVVGGLAPQDDDENEEKGAAIGFDEEEN